MKKNTMRDYSLNDLYLIRDFIETYSDVITMKSEVDMIIKEKEEKLSDLNHKLTIELMEEKHFFDSELLNMMKKHGIKNMQDLLDSNLTEWDDLEKYKRTELQEELVWYDLSRLEKVKEK